MGPMYAIVDMRGWSSDKGLCSEFVHVGCVDKVVDGPHGW